MNTYRLAILLAFAALPAAAQQQTCGPAAQVMHRLADQYGETLQSEGYSSDAGIMQVYAAPEGERTWTIIVLRPDGSACLVAAGVMFEQIESEPIKPGAPT